MLDFQLADCLLRTQPATVQGLAACKNSDIACQDEQPDLDQSVRKFHHEYPRVVAHIPTQIYASIVGGDGSGSVTQQNYINFIYSTLSAIGSADFPR